MEGYVESIGFQQYWGFSKWINILKYCDQEKEQYNILISGASDMRHVFKTCLDLFEKDIQITFVIHEKSKEPFCRQLLFLLIIHTTNLTFRERTDLFLDTFGNSTIRDKSASYIDRIIPYLDDLISNENKNTTALNRIVDLKEIKFKERDELVDIIRSWYSNVPLEIQKLRDQRLRHHYGTRYDYRTNLIDWDYQMGIKETAPIVHFFHYKEWRQSGVAFEQRFSSYPTPNRTLASYLPGKKKVTRESCLVRGYWGDITISPYLSYGISTDVAEEKERLFKIRNMSQVSHSVEVSEFNVQHFIQKFENLTEYHLQSEDQKQEKFDEKNLEKIDEKPEEEIKENDEEQQNDKKKDKDQVKQNYFSFISKRKRRKRKVNVSLHNKKTKIYQLSKSPQWVRINNIILQVLKRLGIKIIPIFDDLDKIIEKSKFKNFFDAGFVSFISSGIVKNSNLKQIFKPKSSLFIETARHIVSIKKEDKQLAYNTLLSVSQENGWKPQSPSESEDLVRLSLEQ